jgi:hypothetical protein
VVGLVPDVTESIDVQLSRVMMQLGPKTTDLDRYIYLVNLLDHNETLFYRTVMSDPARFFADRLRSHDRRATTVRSSQCSQRRKTPRPKRHGV